MGIVTFSSEDDELPSFELNSTESIITDATYLAKVAEAYLPGIEEKLAAKPTMATLSAFDQKIRQGAYLVARSRSFLKLALKQNPDIAFLKAGYELSEWAASGIFYVTHHTALAAAVHIPGLGMAIPAAYAAAREWYQYYAFKKRFGVTPKDIRNYKNEVFTDQDLRSLRLHVLPEDASQRFVPIGRHSYLSTEKISNNFISVGELERLIDDSDFLHEARNLGLVPPLYEELLIQHILSIPSKRKTFLENVELLNFRPHFLWGQYLIEAETFINRITAEASLQAFKRSTLYKAGGWRDFSKNFKQAESERKSLREQIHDLEAFQNQVIADLINKDLPDLTEVKQDFATRKMNLETGFAEYSAKYPKFMNACEDLFAK